MTQTAHYRTLWLSDIHLGYKDCKADYLLDFLEYCRADTLYLVGDIVDMWAMSRQFMWPKSHNQLFHRLLSLSREGTRVIYLPGNHDEPIQKYDGMAFGDIEIHRQYVHTTADGRKLLLMHGDQFDQEVCFGPLHAWIGDKAYDLLLFANRWYNKLRHAMGYPYWSLAGFIKSRIKGANDAIARYRDIGCRVAGEMGMDGIVCGHIHHPEIHQKKRIVYCNTGDWIENCSALTEDHNGKLALVYWTARRAELHPLNQADNRKAA
ncbi:UDP-2,3-diacylglucosamine diphosphatase [Lacimicrobium sp. SS2-24]|uniref:UDP-2,3-diacylglucosamine diphosphatase n=1 Tax=Lacimicrobium sp. SS2-24 TaxID=2005569 RepID=UPI001AF00C7E|nr:UDP-2,3-diacylglucosamine diphosphatase [Lacimicrobium sp. SS2-24]